jgi:hypothetical protein
MELLCHFHHRAMGDHDEEIHEWLTDAEGQLLASDRMIMLTVWKSILLYQGFDIKRILRNMLRI